jgi:hypothetical protein
MANQKTNIDLVKDIMNFSQFGALSQAMVIQALHFYVDMIIEQEEDIILEEQRNIANGQTPFISNVAWVGLAKEIKTKLNAQNKN